MATILLVSTAIYFAYKLFLSHIALQRKEKVLILSLDISRIFYHYKIVLSLFATENKQYFIIIENMIK